MFLDGSSKTQRPVSQILSSQEGFYHATNATPKQRQE